MKYILNEKFIVGCLLSFFLAGHLYAQDTIIKRNGDEIQAQVEEVGQSEIKYKKFDNLTGPSYSVSKTEVFMIRYKNGQRDVFEEEAPPPQSPVRTTVQPNANISFTAGDVSKVRTSAIVGYVAIAPVLGLAVGAALAEDGTAIGGVATLLYGVTLPVIASSASRLRNKSGVIGNPGLRLAGWIGYGLTMADAIIAVGLGASDIDVPDGTVIAIGVLGGASLAMIALDAMATADQAERLLEASRSKVRPTFGYFATNQNKYIPTVGVKIRFGK